MKNKRLYAIVLLAALALLQVRVAFAGCEFGAQKATGAVAACCGEQDSTAKSAQPMDDMAPACALTVCADIHSAPQSDERSLLSAQAPVFAHAPPLVNLLAPLADAPLSVSATPAHPAHTRLIYVLQRLLI